jgi:hypothetical protein
VTGIEPVTPCSQRKLGKNTKGFVRYRLRGKPTRFSLSQMSRSCPELAPRSSAGSQNLPPIRLGVALSRILIDFLAARLPILTVTGRSELAGCLQLTEKLRFTRADSGHRSAALHFNLQSSQSPGRKFRQIFVRHCVTDLDGVATHFAIFKVSLTYCKLSRFQ